MKYPIDQSEIKQQVSLANGERVVLLDRLGKYPKEEAARNVYRLNKDGDVLWRVRSQFDNEGNPFTRISNEQGKLTAYRWDGGTYGIDKETGNATPLQLDR